MSESHAALGETLVLQKSKKAKRVISDIQSEQRRAHKLAKAAYRSYKKHLNKELSETFGIKSLSDFALKLPVLMTRNIEGFIANVYFQTYKSLGKKKDSQDAIKVAQALFADRVNKSKALDPALETRIQERILNPGKKKKTDIKDKAKPKKAKKTKLDTPQQTV